MKDIVNTKIKFREPFRPVRAVGPGRRAEEFFDLPDAARHYPARFMLYVVRRPRRQAGRASRRSPTWTAPPGCRPCARTPPRATTG